MENKTEHDFGSAGKCLKCGEHRPPAGVQTPCVLLAKQ